MREVKKFKTGDKIPNDAKFLSTRVEHIKEYGEYLGGGEYKLVNEYDITWHYFLIEKEKKMEIGV